MRAKKHIATVMAATMVAGSVVAVNAETVDKALIGKNRIETAAKISKDGWKSAETVILVNDGAIADALTATPLAYAKNAPILLTSKTKLSAETKEEIKRLGAKNVILIGGTAVLPKSIEEELTKLGLKPDRVEGKTREETALAIAKRLDGISDVSEIAVVNGTTGLADAVSVAAAAAERHMPILLANPKKGLSVSEKFIKDEGIVKSFIIGGTTALPDKLVSSAPSRQRLSGNNRNDTNAKVIEAFYKGKTLENVYLAKDGMGAEGQLIDALAVGVLAAKNGSPVLIASKKLSEKQKDIINTKEVNNIVQVGGKGNEGAFNQLKDIEEVDVYEVGTVEELKEALEKANANDKIVLKPNATITEDIIISTDKNVDIKVEGTVTGKVDIDAPNGNVTDNSTSKPSTGGGSTNTPSGPSVEERYAAEVNGTKYETFEEAVNSVIANEGINNVTIKLLKNSSGNGIVFKNNKNITIDLNGHTYTIDGTTVGSPGTETNAFQLLKGNTVTIKNGTLKTLKGGILLQNYCDLTLENLNLIGGDSTEYVLSCNTSTTKLTNVNISGSYSGFVGIDVMHYPDNYATAPIVIVNNKDTNRIDGKVEVYCDEETHKGENNKATLIINSGNFTEKPNSSDNNGIIIDNRQGTYAAEVNGKIFKTLEEAMKSVFDDKSNKKVTINLLKNSSGNGIVFNENRNKNITIDLNGYTYTISGKTVGSSGTETNAFQLLRGNAICIKNGTLTASKGWILLQNYCDLTLENLNLIGGDSTEYILSCNNGNTLLENVNISGTYKELVGIDVMHWPNNSYKIAPIVTVNNTNSNTINGKLEVYCNKKESDEEHNDNSKKSKLILNGGNYTGKINKLKEGEYKNIGNIEINSGIFAEDVSSYCGTHTCTQSGSNWIVK